MWESKWRYAKQTKYNPWDFNIAERLTSKSGSKIRAHRPEIETSLSERANEFCWEFVFKSIDEILMCLNLQL